jgi:DNA-binding protein H-NS
MKVNALNLMSIDELWTLHERVAADLATRLTAEKEALESRLKQLRHGNRGRQAGSPTASRPYPKVFPKFRNPDRPSETWAGRGKLPRWLSAQLKSGKPIDDFRIERAAA